MQKLMVLYQLGASWSSQPFHVRQREEKGGMLEGMFHGARLGSVGGDKMNNSFLTDRGSLGGEQLSIYKTKMKWNRVLFLPLTIPM